MKAKEFAIGGALLAIFIACWVVFRGGSSDPNIHTSTQPNSIRYDARDPYELTAKLAQKMVITLRVFPKSDPDRFHSVSLTLLPSKASITKTNWTSEGVEVTFSTNHRVFIPKGSFIGGR